MANRTIVPFGPQHPVLPEPIHLDLVLEDEKVVEAIPSIGFVHSQMPIGVQYSFVRSVHGIPVLHCCRNLPQSDKFYSSPLPWKC